MTAADAYGFAIELANLMSKNIQFFIAVCTAFGGWIIAGKTIKQMPRFNRDRIILAVCFCFPTLAMAYSQAALGARINGALETSMEMLKAGEKTSQYANSEMFKLLGHWTNTIPMLGVIGVRVPGISGHRFR